MAADDEDEGRLIQNLVSAHDQLVDPTRSHSSPASDISERRDNLDEAEKVMEASERHSRCSSKSRKGRSNESSRSHSHCTGSSAAASKPSGRKTPTTLRASDMAEQVRMQNRRGSNDSLIAGDRSSVHGSASAKGSGSGHGSGSHARSKGSGHGSGSGRPTEGGSGSGQPVAMAMPPRDPHKKIVDLSVQLDKELHKKVELLQNAQDVQAVKEKIEAEKRTHVAILEENLDEAKEQKASAELAKAKITDEFARSHAEQNYKIELLKAEQEQQWKFEQALADQALQKAKEAARQAREKEAFKQKAEAESKKRAQAAKEADQLKRDLEAIRQAKDNQVQTLKEELAAIKDSRLPQTSSFSPIAGLLPAPPPREEIQRRLLSAQIEAANKAEELSELRMQVLGLQRKDAQVGDLQMLLERANEKLVKAGATPVTKGNLFSLGGLGDLGTEPLSLTLSGSSSSSSSSGPSTGNLGGHKIGMSRRSMPKRPSMQVKLASIDEDDNMSVDESLAPSIAVSSGAGGGDDGTCVGDLRDFDDDDPLTKQALMEQAQEKLQQGLVPHRRWSNRNIPVELEKMIDGTDAEPLIRKTLTDIQEELDKEKEAHNATKLEAAGQAAKDASTISRLRDMVTQLKHIADIKADELKWATVEKRGEAAELQAEKEQLREILAVEKDRNEVKADMMEHMQIELQKEIEAWKEADTFTEQQEELHGALEAKRMAEIRIEDFKVQITNLERNHAAVVRDLERKVLQLETGTCASQSTVTIREGESTAGSDHSDDVNTRYASLMEEKNMLQNSMEGKEVLWNSKLEDMTLQHEASVLELERRHEEEVRDLKANCAAVQKEMDMCRAALQEKEKSLRLRKSSDDSDDTQPGWSTSSASSAKSPLDWLLRLKCPTRSGATEQSQVVATGPGFIQDVAWQIMLHAPHVVALLCTADDMKIVEVSEKARNIWAAEVEPGKKLLSLIGNQQKAMYLKRAIMVHQGLAEADTEGRPPGFDVRKIGSIDFKSRDGHLFNAMVTVAHLPAEPALEREAALIVVIEMQRSATPSGRGSSHGGSEGGAQRHHTHRVRGSGWSEVSSVRPSDSASNV